MKTLSDGQSTGLELFSSKNGCLFGKSHTSDFDACIRSKILLTKVMNY